MISFTICSISLFLLCTSAQLCRVQPGDANWPDIATWDNLNSTVSGRLTKPYAIGTVCQPNDPSYDNATCTYLASQWSNTSWHASIPWTSDYNDETCPPAAIYHCSSDGYPAYVIETINVADVQAGVNFARDHNIRLVVKGTGHDFPGRSSGRGSLSIWTHRLRGVEITHNDPRAIRYGGVASVKVSAGMRWREIYAEVSKNNITVVGGADPNVGVGGWILHGGHSPISSVFGLGADQVLEYEVVTADGQYITTNETSHPDLFWAMRGGGASFAVMLSVTMKAYSKLSVTSYSYAYAAKSASDTYWSLVAYFHSQFPTISEAGGMGYHYMLSGIASPEPTYGNDVIYGAWMFPNKTPEEAQAIMNPVEAAFNTSSWSIDPTYIAISTYDTTDNIMLSLASSTSEAAGVDGRLGSWLLDGPALTTNFTKLKETIKGVMPLPWLTISHVIAGPGVRNAVATIPNGSNAVNPAWRTAYAHVALPRSWPSHNVTAKNFITADLRDKVALLKALAPKSGAYINEADPSNPSWKEDYFGKNYPKLLEIKNKYDPQGVFWCKPCVGYDQWDIVDGPTDEDKVEWGIGQGKGRLCKRASSARFAREI
ncbi:hypothetical protein H2198_004333 [Neophaeococcomyces mojaviensis]|uniref:Uncharacterized protein n=1 Tax=Neophaeococcomyces mojaviensis TaxID=3383035 RepID=A0ACC3A8Y4_9EURO|nr:hypothetical protein H2198_004333 [Knufia sp. JES_112]